MQTLGKGLDEEETIEPEPPTAPENAHIPVNGAKDEEAAAAAPDSKCRKILSIHEPSKAEKSSSGMVKEFGKLVVGDGRSRYVSNRFWTSLSEEVSELQDILDDPTDDEADYPSPESADSTSSTGQGFLFGFSSTVLSLRSFHPLPAQMSTYWNVYKTNIAPVMMLLHHPYTESLIVQASQNLDAISKPVDSLLFSIYFAVVTALPAEDCSTLLGIERSVALRKYRFATEQAFARANFINTQDIMVLQAMLLFLTAVRRTDDTRYVWTITGLLIRIATSLGLHRDGVQFGLNPFETELRRRLWWQICILDVRASEDQGCEPSISEPSFDTKFPLNINDSDITPTTEKTPQEREGATELTFDLIRYSVSTTVRRLSYIPPGSGPCKSKHASITLEEKEHIIEELHQYIEQRFLRHLDTNIPLHWVAATVARLVMAKMWLVIHHPLGRSDAGLGLPEDLKDRLLTTSVEVIEFSRLLETEESTKKWGWLFRTYIQWHALAFVLSQLCVRTEGPVVDRAWIMIDGVFESWGGIMRSAQKGMMWKPLRKLMERARAIRAKALQQRARFPLDGRLGPTITPLITQPGPKMNGSSAVDYFSMSDSAISPESLNADPVAMSDAMGNYPGMNGYIDAVGDMSNFLTSPQPNITSTINLNENPDFWQFGTASELNNVPTSVTTSGLENGAGPPADTLMTTDPVEWDDVVREFQMDTGPGVGWQLDI